MIRGGREEEPWDRAIGGTLLGSARFVERIGKPEREVPGSRVVQRRWSFEQWCELIERIRGESWAGMVDKYGDPGRDLVLLAARKHGGLSLRELGLKVGLDYGTVANAVHRIRKKIESDRSTANLWKRMIKCYNQKT